jgi:chloramphenicol O-acetyltransferase
VKGRSDIVFPAEKAALKEGLLDLFEVGQCFDRIPDFRMRLQGKYLRFYPEITDTVVHAVAKR